MDENEGQEFKQSLKSRALEYQFDEYDDEYDDTYDSSDIKLADTTEIDMLDTPVPTQPPVLETGSSSDPGKAHEYILVQYYQSDPAVFANTRRKTPDRALLKTQTGLSDEQIEGWGKMLERNVCFLHLYSLSEKPRKDAILERYEWRGNKNEQVAAPESLASSNPQKPVNTARQRQFGQRNKAQVANHNRKRGHDRKLDRGMMGGS